MYNRSGKWISVGPFIRLFINTNYPVNAMFWLKLDREAPISRTRQIYEGLRRKILEGELRGGEKLPSSRQLAQELGLSRIVITEAYEQLVAEGYLDSRQGSGTRVVAGLALSGITYTAPQDWPELNSSQTGSISDIVDFRPGVPALEYFPRRKWVQLLDRVYLNIENLGLGYGNPAGCDELRIALTRYLARIRGIACHPENLIVTAGAAQAFSIISRLFKPDGKMILQEDPGVPDIRRIFARASHNLATVPVDDQGMQTALLPEGRAVSLLIVTPSHQFPLGGVLPLQRRLELIQYARATGAYLLEDDYDSEFRYQGSPVSAMQSLDPDRVIYVGTLSKTLLPAIRLGYAILPPALREEFCEIKRLSDLHNPVMEQLALAHFIEEGTFEQYLYRMKGIYRSRRNALLSSLQNHFGESVTVKGADTGLHLIAEFKSIEFSPELLRGLEDKGVRVYSLGNYSRSPENHKNSLILGYGNLNETSIKKGLNRLTEVLKTI
jgi:GntR family transcriptional regulator / MocR family aminotransferase